MEGDSHSQSAPIQPHFDSNEQPTNLEAKPVGGHAADEEVKLGEATLTTTQEPNQDVNCELGPEETKEEVKSFEATIEKPALEVDHSEPQGQEGPEDSGSDSEIEGVRKCEVEAEKFLRVLEEDKVDLYESLLQNQKAYDDTYIGYLREIKRLNQRYETQFQEVFFERKPTSSKIDNFWLTVLKNNPVTASLITPKDEPLLQHLTEISYSEAKNGRKVILKFEFSENPFIANTELTKTYVLDSEDNLKKAFSSPIQWKGDDLTMKKIVETKKNKRSKAVKKVTKLVSDESFFNLFKEVEDFDDSESDEEIYGMLGDDLEIGFEIKDEIVPYAFMWFLGVRTHEESDDSSDDEEPKEGISKTSAVVNASGSEQANCKQQ